MNVLEIKNLSKEYKDFSLKNINLTLPAGYIMGYVGQNGAGKTTTINLINHICKFKEGSIQVNGISFEDDQVKYRESIAYVGVLKQSYGVMTQFFLERNLYLKNLKYLKS